MLRVSATVAAFVAAVVLMLPGHAAAGKGPTTPLPENFFGVDSVHEPPTAEFELMKQSGLDVFRAPAIWRIVEATPPTVIAGQTFRTYDWSEIDIYFRRAALTGTRIQLGITGTPFWVNPDIDYSPMQSQEGVAGWSDYTLALAERYEAGGSFWKENPGLPVSPPLTYQIWNEQNTSARYKPVANIVGEYAGLLRIAGSQIRSVNPDAEIIPGGMFGTPQTEDSLNAWTYMKKLLGKPGTRQYIDAVAIHPYSPDLRGIKFQFKKMRKVLRRADLPGKPIYVTEFGFSSGVSDRFFFFKGRKGQGKWLRKSYKLMIQKRDKWNLERIIWFAFRDVEQREIPEGCGFCSKFGLFKTDLRPKPSAKELSKQIRKAG